MKTISENQLKHIIKRSISWTQAMDFCGIHKSGGSYQYFQNRVKRLKFDTSHFLGRAAHAGIYQTGISRKKHWSEILIERKTKDRDRSGRLRTSFTEYCKEKNISIKCIDCNGDENWKGKKLKLQINHKDEQRWNNIPNNLEWICPNCHSVKTHY